MHLPLLGAHSVHAALAATAVALEEGFALDEVAEALHELTPTLRLLVVDGINGSRIIDDSYNASPESVLAALNLLRRAAWPPQGRRAGGHARARALKRSPAIGASATAPRSSSID